MTSAFYSLLTIQALSSVQGFQRPLQIHSCSYVKELHDDPVPSFSLMTSISSSSSTKLYAEESRKRIARRDLRKRPNRKGRRAGNSVTISLQDKNQNSKNNSKNYNDDKIIESEIRPLVRSKKVEAGEDYWIDEKDLQKSLQRKLALKNRQTTQGEISKEKLVVEVVAPYKQNWIGLLSVGFVVLAVIIKNFPDLLNEPVIQIPDL